TVPKGAEVLLETRFPYLTNLQRRDVLASTVISSGYPLLDDTEGWGRLNLFAASDGYGSFSQAVEIVMDAQRGGFAQQDIWRNDISGVGGLIKRGTGTLVLAGQNSYTGGTVIQEGILETRTPRSLGKGAVTVTGGSLIKAGREPLVIEGNYIQERNGTLEITLGSPRDGLDCRGTLRLDGLLRLRLVDGFIPFRNPITIITHGPQKRSGQFMSIEVTGASGYRATLQYQTNQIQVVFEKRQ
ncbi:MAG: autotransporter-associated beta strand repeat-containing protein, partial [Breznakiellaceae bacterium]